jgi:hypothetical protein
LDHFLNGLANEVVQADAIPVLGQVPLDRGGRDSRRKWIGGFKIAPPRVMKRAGGLTRPSGRILARRSFSALPGPRIAIKRSPHRRRIKENPPPQPQKRYHPAAM